MHKRTQSLVLLLLAGLLAACNWPLSHPETEPLAAATAALPEIGSERESRGQQNERPSAAVSPLIAFDSPLDTPGTVGTVPGPTVAEDVAIQGHDEPFGGRRLRFDLPEGYRALEGVDGGCFLYHESLPGFLIFYPQSGEAGEMLAGMLNATAAVRRTELPLEVDLGERTFIGLFVEVDAGNRLFFAAADGWGLVVQGPAEEWPALASGLNQVLSSLTFTEGF
ncbi:MAG: hypothetical protein JXA93_18700 [Anaerolineae bacterium]|nr:hypothetical protein [Anaerolineae bacterium]